ATLEPSGEQPHLRDHFHPVARESRIAYPLGHAADDAAEVAVLAARQRKADANRLSQELVESDVLLVLGQQIELKLEELGNALMPGEACQEEGVRPQGSRDRQEPICLRVLWHEPFSKLREDRRALFSFSY